MDEVKYDAENSANEASLVADVVAAFGRLGVAIDPDEEMAPEKLLGLLNGVADRLDALEAENAKLKSAKEAAQRKAKAAEAAAPARPRKIGRMKFTDGPPSPVHLAALIDEAETVELVLSDGSHEIAGIAPRAISGDAWEITGAGLKLKVPELMVHGPGHGSGKQSYDVAGYGLVLDGKQVAWSQRADGMLTIGAGSLFNLADDVIF